MWKGYWRRHQTPEYVDTLGMRGWHAANKGTATSHTDSAHVDTPHGDSNGKSHTDSAHVDTPHGDVAATSGAPVRMR